ncbi:MAG: hypothetical protein Q7T80_08560 [Methanoregula sp.]|nr:hypothetical protein [Methanoregula sp.]
MHTREASALDLFTDSVRLMGDATLCAVMEFDRRLDTCALEKATLACLNAHPILHSRLVRGNGPAFWELVEPVSATPFHAEICPEHYHPLVINPVDPYGPLQFLVRQLRRPSGDVIVINLAHSAADGFGLSTLSSQLLQEYRQPGTIRPAQGGIPGRDTLWTDELDHKVQQVPLAMRVINPMWPDPFGTSRQPSSFHKESISPKELEAIRAHARSFGGSINDVLMAGYFLSLSDLTGHRGPMDLFFPVNLRQHLKDGSRVMSNQATNVSFILERREGEGMQEILPRIIGETKRLKAEGIGISAQVEMDRNCDPEGRAIHRMAEEMVALQKQGLADIFISNPGPVTLPEVDGLTDAYVCYPGGFMPTTCFVTSTFRGRMTITMGYQNSRKARAGTKKAMQLFRHHLVSLAEDVG